MRLPPLVTIVYAPHNFVRSSSAAASCLLYPKALAQAMAVANLYNMTLCVVDMDLFLCFVSGLFVVLPVTIRF